MTYPSFASGEVLRAQDMNAVGLWLVKTQTVPSGVTSQIVTGAFSADYDNYKILWSGGVCSGGATLGLQLGPSSVSGYNTSYETGLNYGTPASGAYAYNNTSPFWEWVGGGNNTFAYASCELLGPFTSRPTKMHTGAYQSNLAFGNSYGMHYQSNSYTGFTLTATGGATMTGGTIFVYGYKK